MAGLEVPAGYQFIVAKLKADAVLTSFAVGGIWRNQPPPLTPYPLVTMNFMSGIPVMTIEGVRVYANIVYSLKVIVKNQPATSADTARQRLFLDLHKTSGTASNGTILSCLVVETIEYAESVENDSFWHLGHMVRVQAQ